MNASSILVAQCSTWKAPVAAGAQPASLVDSTGTATGPVTVTGNLKMYASLKYDCAGQYQTTVEPNVGDCMEQPPIFVEPVAARKSWTPVVDAQGNLKGVGML